MTILVDMDDTIEQLLAAWIDKLNAMYGYAVTPEDSTDWDVSKAFPGLAREQVYDVPRQNDFWKDVEPVPGAAEVMQRFSDVGAIVYETWISGTITVTTDGNSLQWNFER